MPSVSGARHPVHACDCSIRLEPVDVDLGQSLSDWSVTDFHVVIINMIREQAILRKFHATMLD